MASNKNLEASKLKKGKKGEKNTLLTIFKTVAFFIFLILEFGLMILLYTTARGIYTYFRVIFEIIKIITVIYILYRHDSASYKITWIVVITFLPVVGVLAFILWGNSNLSKKQKEIFKSIRKKSRDTLKVDKQALEEIKLKSKYKYNQVNYITNVTGFGVHKNEDIKYLPIGEEFFRSLVNDLKNAKKYIFIEFFIISSGKLWDEIYEILKQKAKEKVEVKIIMDSLGSLTKKPKHFKEELKKNNIELYVFNKLSLAINRYINYRDHRKIIVIDSKVAYTGGINLSDEYANLIERFGYWKDGGIKLTGSAVDNFTVMFLRNIEDITLKFMDFKPYLNYESKNNIKEKKKRSENKGYVLPFADGPDNRKNPIENLYIQTINYAKDYVYMTTPYFIVSETILNAILNSARSGVDVRVIVPYIPDKRLVNVVTKSYYEVLLEAGVKVYEYRPGFIHSKNFVSDDEVAIVGTANLDFRSMNLNFECTTWMYDTNEEKVIKEDFMNMLKECKEISLDEWRKRSIFRKILEGIMVAFSPML